MTTETTATAVQTQSAASVSKKQNYATPGASQKALIFTYLKKNDGVNFTAQELHDQIPDLKTALRGSIRRCLTLMFQGGLIFITGRRRSTDTNQLIWAYSVTDGLDSNFKLPPKKAKKKNNKFRMITIEVPMQTEPVALITESASDPGQSPGVNHIGLLTECLNLFSSVQKMTIMDLFLQAEVADVTQKIADAINADKSASSQPIK